MGIYRLLLRLLPTDFRERNQRELEDLVEALLADRSGLARVRALASACTDVLVTAVRMRIRLLVPPGGDRRTGRVHLLGALAQDLTFGVRALGRRPGFVGLTTLVLALGIGATTTIFTVTEASLLLRLPYADADRIGVFWHHLGGADGQRLPVLNPRDIWDFRAWSEAFESFTYGSGRELIVGGGGDARITEVGFVEAGFFEFFGHRPLHGRGLLPSDDVPGATRVVVLSHRFWADRYGGDPSAVGTSIRVAGDDHVVVGVLPADFRLHLPAESLFLPDADVWTAAQLGTGYSTSRLFTIFTGFGKLRPGLSMEDGQADLDRMMALIREKDPEVAGAGVAAAVYRLQDDVVKDIRPTILMLLAAAALTLLVSCANATCLLLGRGNARAWELSMRTALGAGRARIFLIVLVESMLLAAGGGALGLGIAWAGLGVVRVVSADAVPSLAAATLDGRTMIFTVAVSLFAALAAGLPPAMRGASSSPARVLAGSRRAGGTRASLSSRNRLVMVEVATSLVLLIGAGLLVRSFVALHTVEPGYATGSRVTFRLALSPDSWPTAPERRTLVRELRSRLEALPGVRATGAANQLPLSGRGWQQSYAYDERTRSHWESVSADYRFVSPGLFEALGATLLAGREFEADDLESGRRVIVIDHRLADEAFPGVAYADVVGRRLQVTPGESLTERNSREVVGVVRHLNLHDLAHPLLTQIYYPMTFGSMFSGADHFGMVVSTDRSPRVVAAEVRRIVDGLGAGVALQDVEAISDAVGRARTPARLALVLISVFGVTALLLASIGLYGVLALAVESRTKEIGIRVALGQHPGSVARLVVGQGMRLVAIAVAAGLVCAGVASRGVSALLYGVRALDPVSYLGAAAVIVAACWLACWIPARGALRVDPVDALRVE